MGNLLGVFDGFNVGCSLGKFEGIEVGIPDGIDVGNPEGACVGSEVLSVGATDG